VRVAQVDVRTAISKEAAILHTQHSMAADKGQRPLRVLMVCLGNICRSPTARVVLEKLAADRGVAVAVDSCGTGGWHVGEGAHDDSIKAAKRHGYDLSRHRARQLAREDLAFDFILCMDESNLHNAKRMLLKGDGAAGDPNASKFHLFCEFGSDKTKREVPDPWYTGDFDGVLKLIEDCSTGLLDRHFGSSDKE
jgi:protein-tyrosine phosphatase